MQRGSVLKKDVMDRKMNGVWKDEGKARGRDAFQFKQAACENIVYVFRLPAVPAISSMVRRNGNSRLGFECFYVAACRRGPDESGRSVVPDKEAGVGIFMDLIACEMRFIVYIVVRNVI